MVLKPGRLVPMGSHGSSRLGLFERDGFYLRLAGFPQMTITTAPLEIRRKLPREGKRRVLDPKPAQTVCSQPYQTADRTVEAAA